MTGRSKNKDKSLTVGGLYNGCIIIKFIINTRRRWLYIRDIKNRQNKKQHKGHRSE